MNLINRTLTLLRPPERLKPSEWANKHRILSTKSSSQPGKYSTKQTPYLEEILDCAIDPRIETVVFQKSAQVGATELLLNLIGFFIHQDPGPIMLIQPTIGMCNDISKDRLTPMFEDCPALNALVDTSKFGGTTNLHKVFNGGQLTLAGSNSPSSLRSRPVRVVLFDELDAAPASAGTEGDPVSLVRKRTTTFNNRKIFLISTPTMAGESRIVKAFDESDKRYYFVPCPHCGECQTLDWSQVKWHDDDYKTAKYHCIKCEASWNRSQRISAVSQGHWRATQPFNGTAGFFINELYSYFSNIEKVVKEYLEAMRGGVDSNGMNMLKTWTNTVLGLPFSENLDSSSADEIFNRREDFSIDKIPEEVCYLTCTADTQDDRLEVLIAGFGREQEVWLLSHRVIQGVPDNPEVWDMLLSIIEKTYGTGLQIRTTLIDSGGHYTESVYRFANEHMKRRKRVFAIKGANGERPIWARKVSVSEKHKGLQFYTVGVDTAKDIAFSRLKMTEPGPRCIHLSNTLDKSFIEQLTVEYPRYVFKRGKPVKIWEQEKGRANEAFDLLTYTYIALYSDIANYERISEGTPSLILPKPKKSLYVEQFDFS